MAQFTVRNLEDEVRDQLRVLAQQNGQSMEETVRDILRAAVAERSARPVALGTRIASRFTKQGLTAPIEELRGQAARPAEFGR
jgi:plasmid stability protein